MTLHCQMHKFSNNGKNIEYLLNFLLMNLIKQKLKQNASKHKSKNFLIWKKTLKNL